MTILEAIDWILRHEELLNLSGIAKRLNMQPTKLIGALRGKTDVHGTVMKIPKRCEEPLIILINEMKAG